MAEILGTDGRDTLVGTGEGDDIFGFFADDELDGRGGKDELFGNRRDDLLEGGRGDDTLRGGNGDDELRGQNGDDQLYGGGGDDTLSGGTGDDLLIGGGFDNRNLYKYNVNENSAAGFDTIVGFSETGDFRDRINLGSFGSFSDLDTNGDGQLNNRDDFVSRSGNTTQIDVGAAFGFAPGVEVLTVINEFNSALDTNDFLFVS